jgi:hypothetical protein
MSWIDALDDRGRKEIAWAKFYDTKEYRQGTTGHHQLLLISRMAQLLDQLETNLQLANLRAAPAPADEAEEHPF